MSQTIRLGDLLVRAGVVSENQVNAALAEQKKWGGRLGSILVRMGALSEDLLVKALSKQLGIPRANLDAASVPAQILERIDRAICEKYNVVPLQYVADRRALMMGVSDPFHVVAMDDLSRRVGLRIEPYLAGETAIAHTIARMFGGVTTLTERADEEPLKLMGNDGQSIPNAPARPQSGAWTPPATTPPQAARTMPPIFAQGTVPQAATTPPTEASGQGLEELDRLAKRQAKALRAILELLIEKGVLTREEYLSYVNTRS